MIKNKMQTSSDASAESDILGNRIFLYITEFFAGMSVMAVELAASRLLTPYFSSSQVVWTIIIGTIMIAMALGNIYGGRNADKDANPDNLYKRIIIASIWIALIPVLGKYIISLISAVVIQSVNINFLVAASLISCAILFVFPLFLLGTITPSLAKYSVDKLSDSGKIIGSLGAFNTVGSIIGTFIPTFLTIPTLGVSITFYIFSGILLVIAIIYFCKQRHFYFRIVVGIVVIVVAVLFCREDAFSFWSDDLVLESESVYNYIRVTENDSDVCLTTNLIFGIQSDYSKEGGISDGYIDYSMAAPLMAGANEKDSLDVLVLGVGGGTYFTKCEQYFGNLNMVGVELDKEIVTVATEYFNLSEDIPIYIYDGRAFLNATDKTYDVIVVDAYQDVTIPFQMATIEFFDSVKEHLNNGGVVVANLMAEDKEGGIFSYISDTLCNVFPNVWQIHTPNSANVLLFASENEEMIDVFKENIKLENDRELYDLMEYDILPNLEKYNGKDYLLTDDKAPIERLSTQFLTDRLSSD